MSPYEILLLLATAHVVVAMVPGPNTVLVVKRSLRTRRLGLITALGVWPAGVCWSAFGLLGIGAILASYPTLTLLMKIVCSLYLLYLGVKMLNNSFKNPDVNIESTKSETDSQAFFSGFITNITNPKSVAYFTSIFAATGAFSLPLSYQIVAIVLLPSIGLLWNTFLVILASQPWINKWLSDMSQWADRCAGIVLILFAVKLFIFK